MRDWQLARATKLIKILMVLFIEVVFGLLLIGFQCDINLGHFGQTSDKLRTFNKMYKWNYLYRPYFRVILFLLNWINLYGLFSRKYYIFEHTLRL